MPEPFRRGRFVWYELMTTNPDAAIAFYKQVAGWGITPFQHDPSYRMWTVGKNPIGGVMRLPEEARRMGSPPHWLPYIGVQSVDATVRQATGLGARTHVQPQDIPHVGRFAVLADPQGAAFAVYQSATAAPAPDAAPKRGDISWHELATTNWRAAWDFYQALFGWQKTQAMDMGPAGIYQTFGYGGPGMLGGMYNKPPDMPAPPHWLCYVMVANVDQMVTTVTRLGGKVLNGPMDVPGGGRIAQCLDPQGAAFALHSPPAPAKKKAGKPKKKARPKKRAKAARRKPARKRAPKKKGARRRRRR